MWPVFVCLFVALFRNELCRSKCVHATQDTTGGGGRVFGLRNEEFVIYKSQGT